MVYAAPSVYLYLQLSLNGNGCPACGGVHRTSEFTQIPKREVFYLVNAFAMVYILLSGKPKEKIR